MLLQVMRRCVVRWCGRPQSVFLSSGSGAVLQTGKQKSPSAMMKSSPSPGSAGSAVTLSGSLLHAAQDDASPSSVDHMEDNFLRIKSFYCARKIDTVDLLQKVYSDRPHSLQRDSLVVVFRDGESPTPVDKPSTVMERYMVVFGYGSVVFFNCEEALQRQGLESVQKHASSIVGMPKSEDYGLLVRPSLEQWSVQQHDFVTVQKLDLNNLLVVSGILAQTVALDHFERKVDALLETFSQMNQTLEFTGSLSTRGRSLFRLVAESNSILTDVITKLGLLDRSEIPWKYSHYASLWEGMREEFELDGRFKNFDFKLNLIQHNTQFFLEVLHNKKSDKLEWIIIILIAAELSLGLINIFGLAPGAH